MTTSKDSKSLKKEQSPVSSSPQNAPTQKASPFAKMTSHDFQLLHQGVTDQKQVKTYIQWRDMITPKSILETNLWPLDSPAAKDYQQAIERSTQVHHEAVWEARRKLVAEMNGPTLESLARHYGISPGTECISNHPDADDLDRGMLLARLRQFLVWEGEYHGTAPEMLPIDVEAALVAANSRTKGWQPSDTEILESVLRHASACKMANDTMLVTALRECIAITCVCPKSDWDFQLNIEGLDAQIETFEEQINELRDAEDFRDKDDSEQAKASLKKLKKRQRAKAISLREVRSYQKDFTPGKAMPQVVMDATNKWFAAQFTEGKPVGSIVRVAWLADVFYTFWQKHQSAYLAFDPRLKKLQQRNSENGKLGPTPKADKKWRRFTALFVDHVSSTTALESRPSPTETKAVVDAFSEHLIDQKIRGATDKRTVKPIKEFLATLMSNMDREGNGWDSHMILRHLRDNKESHRKGGQFRGGSCRFLSIETVEVCLEILREGLKRGQDRQAKPKGQRPKRQR